MRGHCSLTKRVSACVVALLVAPAAAALDAGSSQWLPAGSTSLPVHPDPRAAQIGALLAGELEASVSPESLFDVSLDDEDALRVEAARLRAIDRAGPADALADAGSTPIDARGSALWNQRLELDRARLEFYSQGAERRAAVLAAHRARQLAARAQESEESRRAREAEEERARVLEAARAARTETERLVKEELARLIALENDVRAARTRFEAARAQIALRRDIVIGWQRRIRDAKVAGTEQTDATYHALRRALGASRDELSAALDMLGSARSDVPELESDPMADTPPDASTDAARLRRTAVASEIARAHGDERALRAERAAALLDEINALNRERLGLLPYLSASKRDATTGFTLAGWDQARAEGRHLALVLRYHQHVARAWLDRSQSARGGTPSWKVVVVVLPVLIAAAGFWWLRRRTLPLLELIEVHLAARERTERRTSVSLSRRVVGVLQQIHRPLEWLLFFSLTLWLLPTGAQDLLEIQLLASVIGWSLVGALIVNLINALAAASAKAATADGDGSGQLRLRSLRLVGRTTVAFALILVLTARLVGEGTIHSWVFSTCWFAAIPIFAVLVGWWRDTVFERLDRARKKTPLQAWILANRAGYESILAAILGAVQLFAAGAIKLARGWLSGFDLARRAHAYLFKREIERIGHEQAPGRFVSLSEQALAQLHPERAYEHWLSCPGDALRDALARRATSRAGGIVAVIGARGMGKSSLLRAAAARSHAATVIACSSESSVDVFRSAITPCEGKAASAATPALVLVDDAHTLINPSIGGLAKLDTLIAFARSHSRTVTWVLAIDASIWPMLERARDQRPLFDEIHFVQPWDEAQIGALLAERCARAGLSPSYDDLLDPLPPGADELDRQDALQAKKSGYARMLWDHVDGNPALALEAWRTSLASDERGVVHVRPLRVLDLTTLERLPDSSLFVLRAVLQLAPATAEAVARATRLRAEEVQQDFRFGQAHGYLDECAGRVQVTWRWLRAVTQVLERRHLLVRQ